MFNPFSIHYRCFCLWRGNLQTHTDRRVKREKDISPAVAKCMPRVRGYFLLWWVNIIFGNAVWYLYRHLVQHRVPHITVWSVEIIVSCFQVTVWIWITIAKTRVHVRNIKLLPVRFERRISLPLQWLLIKRPPMTPVPVPAVCDVHMKLMSFDTVLG